MEKVETKAKELLKRCPALSNTSISRVEALAGDMSTRQFFRLHLTGGKVSSVVLMILNHAPGPVRGGRSDLTQDDTFVELSAYLSDNGVNVPRVMLDARSEGSLIVQDVGSSGMWRFPHGELREQEEKVCEIVGGDVVANLFKGAIDIINQFQNLPPDKHCLAFQRWAEFEWYRSTISEFSEYYASPKGLKASELVVLNKAYDAICENIRDHPRVLAHFDFMAFNLFVEPNGRLIVLDFQDMSMNSPVRDVVSLINDRDMDSALGQSRHSELIKYFIEQLQPGPKFSQWYNEYLLHWDFRVAGRFLQLADKRGQKQYAKWVPGTLRRLGRTLLRSHRDIHGLEDVLDILSHLSPEIKEGVQDPWDLPRP